jgi:hypothetical protein
MSGDRPTTAQSPPGHDGTQRGGGGGGGGGAGEAVTSLGRWMLGGALLFIGFVTLFPFAFRPPEAGRRFYVRPLLSAHARDAVGNVLLFVPLGAAVAVLARRQRPAALLTASAAAGLVTSAGVELLQVYLPARWPTLTDVVYNASGASVGGVVFVGLRSRLGPAATRLFARPLRFGAPVLRLACFALLCLQVALPLALRNGGGLETWADDYALYVGAEPGVDAQWLGLVSDLHLFSTALPPEAVADVPAADDPRETHSASGLVGSFRTVGPAPYPDRTGTLPPLEDVPAGRGGGGHHGPARLSVDHSLRTAGAIHAATRGVRSSSQFTVIATVETRQPSQGRQRPIVAICGADSRRNFALAQSGNDLYVRLRTTLTGPTAWRPALRVRGVFRTTDPQRVAVTYDGSSLAAYVNGQPRGRFRFTPEMAVLWRPSPPGWNLDVDVATFPVAVFYRLLLFLPSTLLLARLTAPRFRSRRAAVASTALVVFAVAAVTETVLAVAGGASPSAPAAVTTALLCLPGLWTAFRLGGPRHKYARRRPQ